MNFIENIQHVLLDAWQQKAVICFIGPEYPLLFVQQLCRFIKASGMQVTACDLFAMDFSLFKGQFETSFLGMRGVYLLGNIAALSAKKRQEVLAYVSTYRGPHCLICSSEVITELKKNSDALLIEVPKALDVIEYGALVKLLYSEKECQRCEYAAKFVFAQCKKLELDQCCLLSSYSIVMGSQIQQFVETWVDVLFTPESSLFTLSGALFAHDAVAFAQQYAKVKDVYPVQFWISFWSEQLFRARYFVQYKRQQLQQEAKNISFRLPFSFIQKDWKLHTPEFLVKAHDELYSIDYSCKNGGSEFPLDRFYTLFLR